MESGKKEERQQLRVLLAVFLGVLLGAVGITLSLKGIDYLNHNWFASGKLEDFKAIVRESVVPAEPVWPPQEFRSRCNWIFLKVDEKGWSTGPVGTYQDLDSLWNRVETSSHVRELAIPIFPSVYTPLMADKLYYDYLLESDIEPGDKVLVVGTGSGADAWVASLKSQETVYVVEINPQAVVNAKTTARLGNFQMDIRVGNFVEDKLPDHFADFDFVIWNMPFIHEITDDEKIQKANYHDGDNGTILKKFLKMLPSLLKEDGKAIVLNMAIAKEYITIPGVITKAYPSDTLGEEAHYTLFVIPNPS